MQEPAAVIPRFSLDDSEEIGSALDLAGIPYERRGVTISVSRYGGGSEYVFYVSKDRFQDAVQAIKSYYGFLDAPPEPVSGICPACRTAVEDVFECPECGLVLSLDPRSLMKSHPFVVFLEQLEKTEGNNVQ
jgi:rubredoxin